MSVNVGVILYHEKVNACGLCLLNYETFSYIFPLVLSLVEKQTLLQMFSGPAGVLKVHITLLIFCELCFAGNGAYAI